MKTNKYNSLKDKIKRGVLETLIIGTELLVLIGFANGITTCWPKPYNPNGDPFFETNKPCAALRTIKNRKRVLDYNYKLRKKIEKYFLEEGKELYYSLFPLDSTQLNDGKN